MHGVVGGALAQNDDLGGLKFEGLRTLWSERDDAVHAHRRSCAQRCHLGVVVHLAHVHDHLEVGETAAVVESHEAKVLHVAHRARPSAHHHVFVCERSRIGIELGDRGSLHG